MTAPRTAQEPSLTPHIRPTARPPATRSWRRTPMRWLLLAVVGFAAATSVATPATSATASEARSATATYAEQLIVVGQDALRRDPSQVGSTAAPLPELVWSAELAGIARAAADRMAAEQVLAHDPRIREALCCGAAFGDNGGVWTVDTVDPSTIRSAVRELVAAWSGSAGHRDNVLDERFTHVGVGVTISDGRLWAAVVFQDRSDGAGELAAASARPRPIDGPCPQPPSDRSAHFLDVEGRHVLAIDCLTELGIIRGVSAERFAPTRTLTRSQLAMLLDRALEAAGVAPQERLDGAFRDVASDGTAGPAVERLAGAGIVLGRGDGSFGPSREVLRGQLAAQLDAAIRSVDGEPPTTARGYFADVPVDRRFARAIDVTGELGLLAGDEKGDFAPDEPLRRDHAAAVIARLLAWLQERV